VSQALRRWSIRNDVPDFQARDLRRTCKTMLADYLEADEGLMARLHGHALTRVDQKVYNQSKYMRPKFMLLERWVQWLDEVPGAKQRQADLSKTGLNYVRLSSSMTGMFTVIETPFFQSFSRTIGRKPNARHLPCIWRKTRTLAT